MLHCDESLPCLVVRPLTSPLLHSPRLNGNNVRYWMFEGCYKYEIYGAKEWVKPCPSHIQCSVLKNLKNHPFCYPMPMEDPFKREPAHTGLGGPGEGEGTA